MSVNKEYDNLYKWFEENHSNVRGLKETIDEWRKVIKDPPHVFVHGDYFCLGAIKDEFVISLEVPVEQNEDGPIETFWRNRGTKEIGSMEHTNIPDAIDELWLHWPPSEEEQKLFESIDEEECVPWT